MLFRILQCSCKAQFLAQPSDPGVEEEVEGGQKMRQEWGGTRRGKGRKEERPGERLKSKWQTVQMKRFGESRLEGSKGFIRGGGREVKGSGRGCVRENEQE